MMRVNNQTAFPATHRRVIRLSHQHDPFVTLGDPFVP